MINRDYLEIMASALTDKTGVKIRAGDTWRADIKNRILEYDRNDLIKLDFDISKGLLLHELGHIKFTTNPNATPTSKKYPSAFHDIVNAFEDARIEDKLTLELENFASIPLTELSTATILDGINKSNADFTRMPKLHQFLHLALMAYETERSSSVRSRIGYHAFDILNYSIFKLAPEVKKVLNDHMAEIIGAFYDIRTAPDTSEVAEIIERRIIPLLPDDFLTEAEKAPPMTPNPKAGKGKNSSAGQKAKKAGQMASATRGGQKRPIERLPDMARTLYEYGGQARTLGQRLADILHERRATKYSGAHASGRLLSKNAYKILNNENRIFSHKLNNKPDKYRFYFCLDSSGSMGSNYAGYYAVQAGQIMKLALDNFGLPMNFFSYDDEARPLADLADYNEAGSGTDDTYALQLVLNDMRSYPDAEKLVFMLTDGYTMDNNLRREYMRQIKKNAGEIYAIGIGAFQDDGLRANYENIIKVDNPAELPAELLRLMRKLITR